MFNIRRIFIFCFIVVFSQFLLLDGHSRAATNEETHGLSPLGSSAPGSELQDRVSHLLKSAPVPVRTLGLWIGTTQPNQTIFSLNANQLFVPASLSKIITAGAALEEMDPGYKFKTQILSSAPLINGTLKGSIFLRGGGDPSFVSENMWVLVNALTRTGVHTIEGDVNVDDSLFDSVRFSKNRQKERVDRAYDAPVGAMSMNWNSVSIYIRAGAKVGDKLNIFADIQSPYIRIINNTKTVSKGKGQRVSVERESLKGFFGDVFEVTGSMAADHNELVVYKSVTQPDLWTGYNLVEFLRQRGIQVKGHVETGKAPASAIVLAESESKPLSSVVADMAKWSNNYVAEMLVKNLSVIGGVVPGTMDAGVQRVHAHFEKHGFAKGSYEFSNPAGFTRENKLSPEQIGRYLGEMQKNFSLFPEFLSALPIAGVDGTLRNRMASPPVKQWVRAKTGLLNGVVGLAGFAGQGNGEILTFCFLYNGSGKENDVRNFFDSLAKEIVSTSISTSAKNGGL